MSKINFSKTITLLTILVITVFIGACETTPTKPQAESHHCGISDIMDRVAIEEFFYSYYEQFRPDSKHDFTSFYAEDGRMEVNGMVFDGLDKIKEIYGQLNAGDAAPKDENAIPKGVSEMIVTNMKIDLQGDKAFVTFVWHSITAQLVTTEGKITEYGRERTELVKKDGKWLIKDRNVLTEGGMPESLLENYRNSTF